MQKMRVDLENLDTISAVAYNVIRRITREYPLSDAELGNYVRGVVELESDISCIIENNIKYDMENQQ
jgi:formate hydrogenlyase subunit 6/NADH:ubiquinone oxidoreductase subunit I